MYKLTPIKTGFLFYFIRIISFNIKLNKKSIRAHIDATIGRILIKLFITATLKINYSFSAR